MIKKIIVKIDRILFKGFIYRQYSKQKSKKIINKNYPFFKGKENIIIQEPLFDLILMQYNDRSCSEYAFYDIAVRMLALEEYYGLNNNGFYLYKKMHTSGGNYGQINLTEQYYKEMISNNKTPKFGGLCEQHSIEQFSSLIKSIESNGFDENSFIMCDRNLLNMNGSHRIAIALSRQMDYINVDIHNRDFKRRYTRDWFFSNDFSREEIEVIDQKINDIFVFCKQKIGDYYCILFPPAEEYFDEITKDISVINPNNIVVKGFKDFDWEIGEFIGFLRGIYFFDGIKSENFTRKLYYIMKSTKPKDGRIRFRLLNIGLGSPMYHLKNDTGMPEPLELVKLKAVIRNRYKIRNPELAKHYIGDYAHDVIIHSSDNYIQNKAFRDFLSMPKDLTIIFDLLKKYDYAIAESTHDKISNVFPKNYFFFEDFDIYVKEEYLKDIIDTTNLGCSMVFDARNEIVISNEESKYGTRVRIKYGNFTITMFDFIVNYKGIKKNAIRKFVDEKVGTNVFFLSTHNELIHRINAYLDNPNKDYHKTFVVQHKNIINEEELLSAFDEERVNSVKKFLSTL